MYWPLDFDLGDFFQMQIEKIHREMDFSLLMPTVGHQVIDSHLIVQ